MLRESPRIRFGGALLVFRSLHLLPGLYPIFHCSGIFLSLHFTSIVPFNYLCMYYRPAPQIHIYFPFSFLVTVRSRHPETPKINRSGGCDSFSVEGAIFTPSQHAMISLEIGIHRTLHTRPSSVLRCDHPVFADGQTRPPEPLTQSANMAALLFGTQLKLA